MKLRKSSRREHRVEMMRRKTQPLSADVLVGAKLKPHVLLALDRARRSSSTLDADFSILDVGCGRGTTVALLRRDGWRAFGAEIDSRQAELARAGMQALGQAPEVILDISPSGVVDAPDDRFDFVLSEHVVEHVADIGTFIDETWRVLKPGGSAFHVFPSRWRFFEAHVGQPMVHWLPKGRWQSLAVQIWLLLGIEAGWLKLEGLTRGEKAKEYASYLERHTYYRSEGDIERRFLESFAILDTRIIGDTLAEWRGLSTVMKLPPVRHFVEAACVHFNTSGVFLVKGDELSTVP